MVFDMALQGSVLRYMVRCDGCGRRCTPVDAGLVADADAVERHVVSHGWQAWDIPDGTNSHWCPRHRTQIERS